MLLLNYEMNTFQYNTTNTIANALIGCISSEVYATVPKTESNIFYRRRAIERHLNFQIGFIVKKLKKVSLTIHFLNFINHTFF